MVCLSPQGTVERLNRAEAERAGVQRWRALGRHYFRELAGPTAPQLAEQIDALAPNTSARIFHTFLGYRKSSDAVIDMTRCKAGRVYLCIRATSREM